jgi:uncharacterized membrane-anchored protein YjiN (DUF445 family)
MDETARKRRALFRKRAFATGLLLLAAIVFATTQALPPNFVIRLAAAAAEAAIVGGLADWFAVTALFRHPLGIPIPHTALVPSQKNEIGRALGNFVRDKFLDPDLVIGRLRAENRALQLASWLMSKRAGDFIAERVTDLLPVLLKSADDGAIRRFVRNVASEGFQRIELVPLADAAIGALMDSGKHMQLVDSVAEILEPSLGALKETIIEKVGERTGRFFPKYFDKKIGKGIVRGAQSWLRDVRTPDSRERVRLDAWLAARVAEFRASPHYGRWLEDARLAIVSSPALLEALEAVWDEIKREVTADLDSESPQIGIAMARVVRTAGMLMKQTAAMQDYVNTALERLIVDYIAPWRTQIAQFIAEVVESWDARTVAELIELEVGPDLQYVRINGTVIGAAIGVLLFLISAGMSQLHLSGM